MTGYDITRLLPGGPDTTHHDGPLSTDGPWLVLWPVGKAPDQRADTLPVAIIPSHAVVGADLCDGSACRGRG